MNCGRLMLIVVSMLLNACVPGNYHHHVRIDHQITLHINHE